MRSRSELRAERREAERAAQATSGGAFSFASPEGAKGEPGASERECGEVDADSATESPQGDDERPDLMSLADGGPPGLARLRTMPIVRDVPPLHPLRVFVEARDVAIGEAADLLQVSERSLREVLAWRATFPRPKARFIARYLGVDADELFPPRP